MDDAHTVLTGADVLVVGDRDRRGRPGARAPEGTHEIDATGGIVMPGMIDTHRHMWQTAMRGYGADWTLTQYFVWYYLEHGKHVPARGHPRRQPALGLGRARGRRHHHGRLVARPADRRPRRGRGRRARRRCPGGSCWPTATSRPARGSGPPTRRCSAFLERRRPAADDLLGVQLAFDVTGDPAFPEKAAFEVARELGLPVTTHAGVWGATNDDGIRLMHEQRLHDAGDVYVHAATLSTDSYHRIAAIGRLGRRSRPSPSRAPARATRPPGSCAGTASRCRCRWTPASGGAATSSPRCGRRSAPTARASTSRRTPRATPSPTSTCAPSRSSSGPPAAARGRWAATTSAASSRARRPTWC